MQSHQMTITIRYRAEILESILRIIRQRGFRVPNMQIT